MDDFETFWAAYPRRVKKGDARKAWEQTASSRPPIADVVAALNAARNCQQWRRDGGQFIPYPATWLRAECWDDEHEVQIAAPIAAKPDFPAGWWADEQKTLATAGKLGLTARPGEEMNAFRARIRAAIERRAA